jgi:hypothetical protein
LCRSAAAASALLAAIAHAAPAARADDWLALHPECAFDAQTVTPGRMAILYPRPGLPAVVAQGERLVTRVRVPSGLTPPPGIQQDRALVGWSADLLGEGIPIEDRARHRYALRVVDVRPDGPSSLVYRASILVPHWAAPGTYGLRMTAPGGGHAVAGSVRVVARGETPRIGLVRPAFDSAEAPADALARISAALARLPADVWLAPDHPGLRAALAHAPMPDDGEVPEPVVPLLLVPDDPNALAIVLRHGEDAFVFGSCDGRFVRFDEQVDGILGAERLRRRTIDAGAFPDAGRFAWLDAEGSFAIPAAGAVTASVAGGTLAVAVSADHPASVLVTAVALSDGRAIELGRTPPAGDAAHSFYPATPVGSVGFPRAVALRFEVPSGALARVRRGERTGLDLGLRADPPETETGLPVTLRAEPSRPVAFVGWQLEEDVTAVGPEATRAYGPIGAHRVHAFAIASDGASARADTVVEVRTREVTGCDCRAAPGSAQAGSLPDFWLLAALLLLRRVRPRRRGNTRCRPYR